MATRTTTKTAGEKSPAIVLQPLDFRQVTIGILGRTPLLYNRMAEKAKRDLLLPSGTPTSAEKAARLKHDPMREFRDSAHVFRRWAEGPTYLAGRGVWFHQAMQSAALDVPGGVKAQTGRLTWPLADLQPLWGVPVFHMKAVRSADIARTPDIRTRMCVPRWGMVVSFGYMAPKFTEKAVLTLLNAAGWIAGVGDGRIEKGALNYGQFELVSPDDPRLLALMAEGGRTAQLAAVEDPGFYDEESEELYLWFVEEVQRRGKGELLAKLEDLIARSEAAGVPVEQAAD